MDEMEQAIMNLIVNAGSVKMHAYEALRKVNEEDYDGAEEEMKKAAEALNEAHNSQTGFIQKEASGEKVELSLLLVHAQDHIMTAISEKNLIEQIIELRKIVNELKKK